jgi:long-chain acyl-CoA synthetase
MSAYAAKPWLKFYEPHVPEHIDYPQTTIPDALRQTARRFPDYPAVIFQNREISYRDYDQSVDRFAAALQGLGVEKGDRVAVHLPNCPQFCIAYNGVLRCGAIAVPCNPIYTAREMTHQLNDSGAGVIVTLSRMYPLVKAIRAATRLRHVIVAKIKTYFPPITRFLFTLFLERKSGHKVDIAGDANTHWFDALLAGAPASPRPVEIHPDDTAVLMYTGGTTGVSKGAQLTHKNLLANAYQVIVWVDMQDCAERALVAIPLYHSYGMTCGLNTGALRAATGIMIPDPRDVEDVLKNIQKHHPTLFPGVPAMYVAINHHPRVSEYDLTSLKMCNSGAAPLPLEVQQRFQALTGARLIEGYGLSEATPVTHGAPAYGEDRIGTIGLPYPDTEAKIVDAEMGERDMPVGEVGELCLRGPQVMKGYWSMPTETANVLRDHGDGGPPWLHTGDMACMDTDGYFRIVDRKKDMILGAGGYNVYPREIEEVLYEHPKVMEAAAVGVPMADKVERVRVYVVLKEGETATEEELIAHCRQNLAPYKVPKSVAFRDELPKTMVGKVLRRALREEAQIEQQTTA